MNSPMSNAEQIFRSRLWPNLPHVSLARTLPYTQTHSLKNSTEKQSAEKKLLAADTYQISVKNYDVVGRVILRHEIHSDGTPYSFIGNVARYDHHLASERANKGAVLAAYLELAAYSEATGEQMQSGISLTPHSMKLWNILMQTGVAELSRPFTEHVEDGELFYFGLAKIRPSSEVARI